MAMLGGLTDALGLTNQGQTQMMQTMMEASRLSDPFGPYRGGYAQQLQQLMADPSSIVSNPGYMFGLQQGEQGLLRQAAATGGAGSGGEKVALQQYDQQYAGKYYQDTLGLLAGLSGANIGPNTSAMAQGGIAGAEMGMQRGSNLLGMGMLGLSQLGGLSGLFGGGAAAAGMGAAGAGAGAAMLAL